jgi:hypothetical protein
MRGGALIESGSVYHVISRFVAKEWFLESDVERRMYLTLLGSALEHTGWRCFSYALMSSHIHLGLLAGAERLVTWMRPMHTVFANWINQRRDRIGAVFVRGPNVIDMRAESVPYVVNYIHCNPVRAGVVARPSDSDWTSHRAYVGLSYAPRWLAIDVGVDLGVADNRRAFGAWIEESPTTREMLDEFRIRPPRKPGRPRLEDENDTADWQTPGL